MSDVAQLRAQAAKCRRLARSINDERTIASLTEMADRYEAEALAIERFEGEPIVGGQTAEAAQATAENARQPNQASAGTA